MNKNIHQKSKQAILFKIQKGSHHSFLSKYFKLYSNFKLQLRKYISIFPLFFKRFFNK